MRNLRVRMVMELFGSMMGESASRLSCCWWQKVE